jgi:hypothetical protein
VVIGQGVRGLVRQGAEALKRIERSRQAEDSRIRVPLTRHGAIPKYARSDRDAALLELMLEVPHRVFNAPHWDLEHPDALQVLAASQAQESLGFEASHASAVALEQVVQVLEFVCEVSKVIVHGSSFILGHDPPRDESGNTVQDGTFE